jgi:hypothetical protein
MRSLYKIVRKSDLEILTDLHVLSSPHPKWDWVPSACMCARLASARTVWTEFIHIGTWEFVRPSSMPGEYENAGSKMGAGLLENVS